MVSGKPVSAVRFTELPLSFQFYPLLPSASISAPVSFVADLTTCLCWGYTRNGSQSAATVFIPKQASTEKAACRMTYTIFAVALMSRSAPREYIYRPATTTLWKKPFRQLFNILDRYGQSLNFGLIQTKHAKQQRSCQGQLLLPQCLAPLLSQR